MFIVITNIGGQKCIPSKLLKAGFTFEQNNITDALSSALEIEK